MLRLRLWLLRPGVGYGCTRSDEEGGSMSNYYEGPPMPSEDDMRRAVADSQQFIQQRASNLDASPRMVEYIMKLESRIIELEKKVGS
jgi:hypothetical protein